MPRIYIFAQALITETHINEAMKLFEGESTTQQIESKETTKKHTCLSCGLEYEGNFCPNCGQSHKVGRLSIGRILSESIPDILNLDNKFVRTCIDLFRRPGKIIIEYIRGNRAPYYKPVSLLFVLASILIIVSHLCNIDTEHKFDPSMYSSISLELCGKDVFIDGSFLERIVRTIYNIYWNEAWSTIISITIFVIPLRIVFRKTEVGKSLNFAEYFFIMLFLNCQSLIVKIVQIPLNYICSFWVLTAGLFDDDNVSLVCNILWFWAFMQIFGTGKRRTLWNFFKASVLKWVLIITIAIVCSILIGLISIWLIEDKDAIVPSIIETLTNKQIPDSIGQATDSLEINLSL